MINVRVCHTGLYFLYYLARYPADFSQARETWQLPREQIMLVLLSHTILILLLVQILPDENFQEEKIYTVSEVTIKPTPTIGLKAFQDRWSKRAVYPQEAIKNNIQGMVFIEFIVDKDSTVHDAAVRSGIGHGCDEAALRSFQELSRIGWNPGILKDEPVKVKMVLPFFFRILQSNGRR